MIGMFPFIARALLMVVTDSGSARRLGSSAPASAL